MYFLAWLPKSLQRPFCPGVFIAFLACGAAIVTFLKDPSWNVKLFFIALFFGLMYGELSMMSKDRDTHDKAEKNARDLAQQQSANIGFLMLQSIVANSYLTDIKSRMEKAKGNPPLIADLQAKAPKAQAQADNASKALLLAMVPGIVDELRSRWEACNLAEMSLDNRYTGHATRYATPEQKEQAQKDLFRSRSDLNARCTQQAIPIMTTAN